MGCRGAAEITQLEKTIGQLRVLAKSAFCCGRFALDRLGVIVGRVRNAFRTNLFTSSHRRTGLTKSVALDAGTMGTLARLLSEISRDSPGRSARATTFYHATAVLFQQFVELAVAEPGDEAENFGAL